jgi:hypothetical protein
MPLFSSKLYFSHSPFDVFGDQVLLVFVSRHRLPVRLLPRLLQLSVHLPFNFRVLHDPVDAIDVKERMKLA